MPRFSSITHAPTETRRLLRERLLRCLGREPRNPTPMHRGQFLSDEDMLNLLLSLRIEFGCEWPRAQAVYEGVLPADGSEPALKDKLAEGWARLVWGRVEVSSEISLALSRAKERTGSFAAVWEERFNEHYTLKPDANLEGELLATAQGIKKGEIEFHHLECRSPEWVAARLWEQILSDQDDLLALRTWVDRWKILSTPEIIPSQVWDEDSGERFRKAALHIIESEEALEGWSNTYIRFAKEIAIASDLELQNVQANLPPPPQTLVEQALWLKDNRMAMSVHASGETCNDVLALMRPLLADINEHSFSQTPHPLAVRLIELAIKRPDLLFCIILSVSFRPKLMADLLMHPSSCALACLIIAQWHIGSSAFDRELIQQFNEQAKATAFEDGVSILIWLLEKQSASPVEAAALFAWLHRSAGSGFINDLVPHERLRIILSNALLSLDSVILATIVDDLAAEREPTNRLGGRFAAALELISRGDLTHRINPAPLVEEYIDAVVTNDFNLSAQRLDYQSTAALLAIARRMPDDFERFLYPINVRERLADADKPDANPYQIASDLARSLRTHIRVLCRAIVGCDRPISDDIFKALKESVWAGALDHRAKGRIAAFAARNEANNYGGRNDRPIATDLASVLSALSEDQRKELLSVILETDEPMVLAQLIPFVHRDLRPDIERRLESLPPSKAAETHTLTEIQARINELISAGALGAAKKYIAEEEKIKTLGPVQGREVARLRSRLHILLAQKRWEDIFAIKMPSNLDFNANDDAAVTMQFYRGLAILLWPEKRDPEKAIKIFESLSRQRPAIAVYTVNAIAAKISSLLPEDIFGSIENTKTGTARNILKEIHELTRSETTLTSADRETLCLNEAILRLALNEPGEALNLLPLTMSVIFNEQVQAYRAIALFRLGKQREAVAIMTETEDSLGKTELLEAAWAQIRRGAPFAGNISISPNDDPVIRIREAYQSIHALDPIQQATIVSTDKDPLMAFVIEQVRGASSSIISLVPMMDIIKIDSCEDDLTSVIRELLLSRLDFLRWSVPDQSKGGITAKGNPGERDLMITRGSTVLAIIEAVICNQPPHWKTVQDNLRTHFQKLFSYGTCRLFFHLTYVYQKNLSDVIEQLKRIARNDAPPDFTYLNSIEIPATDSRPNGFIAHYKDSGGELKVVFLTLNLSQDSLKSAAAVAISRSK